MRDGEVEDGRRNRYQIQGDLPLGEPVGRQPTLGGLLDLLVEDQRARPCGLDD